MTQRLITVRLAAGARVPLSVDRCGGGLHLCVCLDSDRRIISKNHVIASDVGTIPSMNEAS